MPKIKLGFQSCLSLLVFFAIVGVAFSFHQELIKTLMLVNPQWIVCGLIFYGINYLFRALRLHVLSNCRINVWPDTLYASSLHGFITYLIPLQAGDLSLPAILKSINRIELAEGSAILVRTRLLDMMSLGGIMILAALFSRLTLPGMFSLIWIVSGTGLILFPLIFQNLISKKYFQLFKFKSFFKYFCQAGKFKFPEILLSLGIWISIACVIFCVVRAVNLSIGFGGALLLISLQLPLQLLPIQGFANTGNHEGGWVAALSILGIPIAQAAEFAVASHLIILFYVLSLGIVPLLLASYKKKFLTNEMDRIRGNRPWK